MRSIESDWTRGCHQSVLRNRSATLRHVRVHVHRGKYPSLYSDWGTRPTLRHYGDAYSYPEGVVIVSSPERPFFRAIWFYEECYSPECEVECTELSLDTSAWESRHSGRIGQGVSCGWWDMADLPCAIHRMTRDLRGA